jgi:hypothetical protein
VGAAAAADAVGTAAEAQERDAAPALIAARAQALLIGLLRLALAFGGLALALARGLEPRVAVELFALAAGLLVFAVYARGGRGRELSEHPPAVVGPVRVEPNSRALATATYPSTIGLTVLTAIALGLNPSLAAILSGLLGGLGITALLAAAEIAFWERRHGGRLLAEGGPKGRVFVERG